ncbi:hypothetical protein EUX98_g2521 [Antrodiella citrinella]|uniref:Uncharacterized protein n=1 Tax=Antrodiella citrinella TaxID=2447956 RepID=A0A4S4MYV3_9APHY|nr:hypothetical protein EUX98_g2521 [Antrodiella citrinella]
MTESLQQGEDDPSLKEDHGLPFPSAPYLASYHSHLESTGEHLSGRDDCDPLDSGFLNLSFWTSAEKDVFFHGLSVYSRLRPDLIAADIGTKNVVEVTTFIDLLEDTITQVTLTGSGDSDWNELPQMPRSAFPIAMEVSGEWCKWEERQAAAVTAHEPAMIIRATNKLREEATEAHRLEIWARKKLGRSERDRQGEKGRKKELDTWVEAQEHEWQIEDFSSCLDGPGLAALDTVLRDAEDDRIRHTTFIEDEDAPVVQQPSSVERLPTASGSPTSQTSAIPAVDRIDFDIEVIDPALRDMNTASQAGLSSSSGSGLPQAVPNAPFQPNTPPFAATPLLLDSSALSKRSEQTPLHDAPLDESESGVLPQNLSPVSRRRLYKRMYMRRKRAEKAGTMVNQTVTRLKPGRKAKTPAGSKAATDDNDKPRPERHAHSSGLTQPYKTRANVTAMGLDAERIRGMGFDMFRLSNVHKLMRTYNELHDADPSITSSISADVLTGLQAHLVQFVRAVTKKVFLSRSFERQAKARTKVWRISQRPIVRKRNVKHGLAMYAGKVLTKKRHFRHLRKNITLHRVQQPTASEAGNSDEEEEEVEVARLDLSIPKRLFPEEKPLTFERKSDKTKKRMPAPIRDLSTIRTARPPDINIPYEWEAEVHPARQGFLGSRREFYFPTPWGSPERARNDECIASDTDEEEFDAEMDEEDRVEADDAEVQAKYEQALWTLGPRTLGKRKREHEDDGEDNDVVEEGEAEEEGNEPEENVEEEVEADDVEDVEEEEEVEDEEVEVEEEDAQEDEDDGGLETKIPAEEKEDAMGADEDEEEEENQDAVMEEAEVPKEVPVKAKVAKAATVQGKPPPPKRGRRSSQRKKFKSKEYISDSD